MDQPEMFNEDKRRSDYNAWADEAREKGWKSGYPAAKFKEQYGEWPPREWANQVTAKPTPPGHPKTLREEEVLSYHAERCPTCGR